MKLKRAQAMQGRKARLVLDRARNPADITLHAARRFIQDAIALGAQLAADDVYTAQREVRELCQRAKRIYRGKDCYILQAAPWWIFYRDQAVVSVIHDQSPRKWPT